MDEIFSHVGINTHRLSREPQEYKIALAWAAAAPETLGYLLCGQDPNRHDEYTQRDATVAATVMQWLGSPVGEGFLAECGYVKK